MKKHDRRYTNINLYFNTGFVNLGLERMKGLYKSNNCLELLNKKVKLSTDVVCSTTDGVSIMEKMANDFPAEYHLCFAHAIHLVIEDVIYKINFLSFIRFWLRLEK